MSFWAVFIGGDAPVAINVDASTKSAVQAQYGPEANVVKQAARIHDGAFRSVDRTTGALVDDLPRARAWAMAKINRERAAAGDAQLTVGQAVTLAYTRKGEEAADYASLSAAALSVLDGAKLRTRFPFLMAAAEARSVPVATISAEVRAGKAASEAKIARIEAKADLGKHAARAATTTAGVIAAASIDWSV